jgi:uncharacterized protein (DUF1810 family)
MTTEAKLAEFVAAQDEVYDQVVLELRAGRKETHWIWFIFPQMAGLGFSPMSQKFGIASKCEAQRYLQHKVLGSRLRECTQLLLALPDQDIDSIMGYPDNLKSLIINEEGVRCLGFGPAARREEGEYP